MWSITGASERSWPCISTTKDCRRLPLVVAELLLVVALPIAVLTEASWLRPVALTAALLGVGFVIWITRLLLTGSTLPCACSFSAAPTSRWSLARALCVVLVVAYVFVPAQTASEIGESVATMVVGLAVAGAVFVLPEALGWPPASKALMQRVEAFQDAV